ncbi:MAG: dienelactone hydrolase family protein [Spirulinaceae cyanobacterium]
MNSEEIMIKAVDGGSFKAYLAKPAVEAAPGLILIQEIFGVNQVMRDLADSYTEAGYLVIVPDLFWRQEPGVQLSDQSEAEGQQALELYEGFSEDKGIDDLVVTLNTIRSMPNCSGKVGSVGYCLGGKLAYLMASRTNTDCDISYYGVGIENSLDELASIKTPTILHLAEEDEFVPPEARALIIDAFNYHPGVTLYTYSNVNHGFARVGGQSYDQQAATLANQRTKEFLEKHLG